MYDIGFIGFGEAARAFTRGWRETGLVLNIAAYDVLFDQTTTRENMTANCLQSDVSPVYAAETLARTSRVIISAVTPDQVETAATSIGSLAREIPYFDINSAAPEKKKLAAASVGEGYLDVAILSPVLPKLHGSPILIAGPRAEAQGAFIHQHFPDAEIISPEVGAASLVKMIRSVFVKGLESITMECALAAYRAGLAERIFPSLDEVLRFTETKALADYTMERVARHGVRRAAEMMEVCDTLAHLGTPSWMSQGSEKIEALVGGLNLGEQFGDVPRDAEQIAAEVLTAISDDESLF